MVDTQSLRRVFREAYGGEPRLFSAPGRVNLIGEHTDYNEGFVLPMAIDRRTFTAAAPRADRRVRVRSLNAGDEAIFDLDRPGPPRRALWLDYVEGVAWALQEGGAALSGADLLIDSSVPEGAGLSSSAALEISTGLALLGIAGLEVDRLKLALAGQRAEHEYVGIKSGIMDQYTATMGRAGHALLIDCRSLESLPIPLRLGDYAVVVCDSRIKHQLAASEYNTRRAECERGVALLGRVLPGLRALRDVTPEEFLAHEGELPEPIRRRCRHVVFENARTLAAADALRAGDLAAIGRLMAESHCSLRFDYEVSSSELDLLVETAVTVEGVAGARMTGGGFGGCTVNLVRRDRIDRFSDTITSLYSKKTGIMPGIYPVEAADGAREEVS